MKKLILAGLLIALSSVAVFADTFVLKNGIAPSIFYEVYISPSDSDDWGDDLLGDAVIEPGKAKVFTSPVSLKSTTIDIMVVDQMGNTFIVSDRRVRNDATVTITINDLSLDD
ncbi:hypothetical protein FACS1894200_00960 [Spirochaetia bacterium]|nr:hypothetical protein FACS1894200_00960 [Spirochaetia bacterium]